MTAVLWISRFLGTLGLSDQNLRAIQDLPGVVKAEGSYSVDTICQKEGEQDEYVIKVMSAADELNQIEVTEGKLPSGQKECLVDEHFARGKSAEDWGLSLCYHPVQKMI